MHLELYKTCMPERVCKNNEQLNNDHLFCKRHPSQIFDMTPLVHTFLIICNYLFTLHQARTKTLVNTTIEHARLRKFQNISQKKLSMLLLVF